VCALRLSKKRAISTTRPLVGVFADGAARYGRDVVRGAMLYANAHRQWEVYGMLRRVSGEKARCPTCDGAILAGVSQDWFDLIRARSRFVVSTSGSTDPALMPTICLDDAAVGTMAAKHLIDCGLKSFSFYGVPGRRASDNRQASLSACVQQHGHAFFPCPYFFPGWAEQKRDSEQPWTELATWLMHLPKPIGIMAVDDAAAAYLVSACRHANLSVPEQIAVIGVNNDEVFCEIACTPISSVDAGFARAGYGAALLLDRLLRGEKLTPDEKAVRVQPLGIVRRLSTDLYAIEDVELAKVIRYIREHACDPCTVDQVAHATAIGRRNLERRFLRTLGHTPGEEILRVQMETAKRLLLQPELSLTVIAERSGFSGTPAFSRAFARINAMTPSHFRRTARTALAT